MNRTNGLLALTTTALILGTFGVLIRELAKSFSNAGQVFARSFFALLIILVIVYFKKVQPFKIAKENIKYIVGFSIVLPLSIIFFTTSANLIKVTNSLFMLYVGSLVSTAFIGKFLFKEKFSAKHVISLIVVFIGLCFFVDPFNLGSMSLGVGFGLLSGLFEGFSHTLRKLMKNISREVIVFYQSLSGVVLATFLLLTSNEPMVTNLQPKAVVVAMAFGVLMIAIGYLLSYGFANFDVNWGTIILATELFFAIVINSIFLKEYPSGRELIGGILIFSVAIITSLDLGKKK